MNPFAAISLLIVDDEPEIRSGIRSIIPWEDYSVTVIGTAANGAEALDMIRFYEPDIVITDIQMPGMNGLDLIGRVKQEQFDCSFVILSGYDDFQYAKTAIRYGVDDYLLKPISIQELTDLIKKLCQQITTKRCHHTDQLDTLHTLRNARISLQKQKLIPQLLRGELSAAQLDEAIKEYGFPIQNRESTAVLIQAFAVSTEPDSEEDIHAHLTCLKEQMESKRGTLPFLISRFPSSGLLLMANSPFSSKYTKDLREFLESCIQKTDCGTPYSVTAAIGCTVPDLMSIQLSYQKARQLMTWHIYPELGPVIGEEILSDQEPSLIMPGNDILECILRNDRKGICEHFHRYFSSLRYVPLPPPSYLYSMCNYLIIDLRNQLSRYMDQGPKSLTGNSYLALQGLSTLEEIDMWMCEILCKFAEELAVSRISRTDPLIDKAIHYIHDNILNNIRTEDVCSYLGLSKSYFSTYFKSKTNLNFRDYTLDLKISYAQEQLKLEQNTPTETALQLGYEDYRSFSRAFKTRTGMSPSDYQRQYLPEAAREADT